MVLMLGTNRQPRMKEKLSLSAHALATHSTRCVLSSFPFCLTFLLPSCCFLKSLLRHHSLRSLFHGLPVVNQPRCRPLENGTRAEISPAWHGNNVSLGQRRAQQAAGRAHGHQLAFKESSPNQHCLGYIVIACAIHIKGHYCCHPHHK